MNDREQNTVKFYEEFGYFKCRESRLREIGGDRQDSIAVEAANQIRHLKNALSQLISIVEIHSEATNNNFAWAELDYARDALIEDVE